MAENIKDVENGSEDIKDAVRGPRLRELTVDESRHYSKSLHYLGDKYHVPQLRVAFSRVMPFVDEDCDTAYTDCKFRVGLSPELLDPEKTPFSKLGFVVLHEVMHCIQKHDERGERKGVTGKLWNFATDLEINSVIAGGVEGINLEKDPSPTNGHWENLWGTFEQIDQQKADEINEIKDENGKPRFGRTYKAGDWLYRGGLFPRQGEFYDFDTNRRAEEYLDRLFTESEDMTLADFLDQMQGNGPGQKDTEEDKGQGEGDSKSGDGGTGNGGSQNGDDQGAGEQDGSNGSGSGGGEENGQGGNSGCGQNDTRSAQGSNSGSMSDGWGGNATEFGKGHVKVDHIYKRNSDGTTTEVGKNAIVDDLNVSQEIKDKLAEMGINPISRSEEQTMRDQLRHDIENYRRDNGYGNSPGDMLLNYVERGLRRPVVNWKKIFRHTVSKVCEKQSKGHDDYTYSKRSRRYSRGKVVFPGMTSYTPTIRFALDTSGSMSANEYHKALSEAEGILKLVKADIECCCVDTVASEVVKAKHVKDLVKKLVGGGGTDMAAAVHQVCEDKPKERPDVLIIATDGCYDWDSLAKSLEAPEMLNVVPIVLLVFKFTEDSYYSREGDAAQYQEMLRRSHKQARVLQAWV